MLKKYPVTGRRKFSDNVFVGLDDDIENVGVTIFSPALREQSFLARKQEYLRNVENVIGLKRGLLSEVGGRGAHGHGDYLQRRRL